jgi:hypothetical protein
MRCPAFTIIWFLLLIINFAGLNSKFKCRAPQNDICPHGKDKITLATDWGEREREKNKP